MIDMDYLNKVFHLTPDQREIIMDLSKNLQVFADLSQADVFIDCLLSENEAIVVAEANPKTTSSLYKKSVVGEIAFEETEPGVMFSLKTGKPIVRSRGITQENVVMQQDIVPINDANGKTIAVLIKESDISQDLENKKKMKTLMQNSSEKNQLIKTLTVQEIHHRVKNNLQVIASMLRLRMRRASSPEAAEVFQDSASRILSMAMVHDYLAQNAIEETDVKFVMEKITSLLISSVSNPDKKILCTVKGESLYLPAEKATSLALVVIELVQNCIKHAFSIKEAGEIKIDVKSRKQMVYLTVSDDGSGMDETVSRKRTSLGLQIVEMLVEEQLQGVLSYFYSDKGTKVTITFPFIDREFV